MKAIVGLIGCDDPVLAQAISEELRKAGYVCEPQHAVDISQVVDRASLLQPPLLVIVAPPEHSKALLQELGMVTSSHLIVLGRTDDPRQIISAMHAGAADFVDINDWQATFHDSIVRFRTRTAPRAEVMRLGRLIGVLSPAGGTGVTTVAANLAIALAKHGDSAMLMDMRYRAGDLSPILNLQPNYSVVDLCNNLNRLDEELFAQILASHSSGVQLLAAPRDFSEIPLITHKGLRRAMAMGKRLFPFVVIDLGQAETAFHEDALTQADALIIVIRLDYPSIRNARRYIEYIEGLGFDRRMLRLIANRCGQRYQIRASQAEEALGMPIETLLPDDVWRVNYAVSSGNPIVCYKPRSSLARRFAELASSLNALLA